MSTHYTTPASYYNTSITTQRLLQIYYTTVSVRFVTFSHVKRWSINVIPSDISIGMRLRSSAPLMHEEYFLLSARLLNVRGMGFLFSVSRRSSPKTSVNAFL